MAHPFGKRRLDRCTGYFGYPFEKCVTDDAIRSFPTPSLNHGDGDASAQVAVYCSVLERISEVASTAAPKGSLYHHFPGGKEALATEAVSAAGQAITHDLDGIVASGAHFGTALALLTGVFRERLQTSDFQKGCPLATVVLEMAATSDLIQNAARTTYHIWQTCLEQLLIASGWEPSRAPAMALFALSAIEGALLLCRAERSTQPLEQVVEELRLLVEGGA